jgi:hypothetical protein
MRKCRLDSSAWGCGSVGVFYEHGDETSSFIENEVFDNVL